MATDYRWSHTGGQFTLERAITTLFSDGVPFVEVELRWGHQPIGPGALGGVSAGASSAAGSIRPTAGGTADQPLPMIAVCDDPTTCSPPPEDPPPEETPTPPPPTSPDTSTATPVTEEIYVANDMTNAANDNDCQAAETWVWPEGAQGPTYTYHYKPNCPGMPCYWSWRAERDAFWNMVVTNMGEGLTIVLFFTGAGEVTVAVRIYTGGFVAAVSGTIGWNSVRSWRTSQGALASCLTNNSDIYNKVIVYK